MLKAILLIITLLSCVGIGRTLSSSLKRRAELLSEILAAMRVLRLRMLNSMEPIGILLRKSDCALFQHLGNALWENGGLYESWKEVRDAKQSRGSVIEHLTEDDLILLDTFFKNLGNSGREEQNAMFASVIEQMEHTHGQVRARFLDISKVYTALGTLIGIGICIIIV